MSKWIAAGYFRLSREDGDNAESDSIKNQKDLLTYFLKKEKDIKINDYYIDDGYSGTDFERPDFQRMLSDIMNGKINTIIVKDLSRFGRNYIEVGKYLEEILPSYNIRFIAINDNIDSYKDPKSVNNIIVPFKNLMNDEYARDVSNKVRSILDNKKTNGEFIGIAAPYGYLKDPNNKHKFIVDKNASKVVKKIFSMALDGKSKCEIVSELNKYGILTPSQYKMDKDIVNSKKSNKTNLWNTKMIDRILQNQSYTGDLIQNKRKRISHKVHKLVYIDSDDWIIVPNHHTSLISKEKFNQIQNTVYNRDNRVNKEKKYDVFSGHLKCNECGNILTIRRAKGIEYFYCTSYVKKKTCSKHTTRKNNLEEMVLKIINNQIELVIDLDNKIDSIIRENDVNYDYEILKNRIYDIEERISKYNILKNSVKIDYENDYISKEEYKEYEKEYNFFLTKLNNEKDKTITKIEKTCYNSDKNKNWIQEFKKNKNINTLTKKVVDELIDDIFVYENGNIKICFKYQDEYFEAIDFIKKHNCDIISNEFLLTSSENAA